MNPNYYTPDISEFYVGFEYESLWGLEGIDGEWHKEVFTIQDSVENLIEVLRVKYLDIQDIEELGYTVKWDDKFKVFNANVKYNDLDKMLCFDPTNKRNGNGTNIQTFRNGWFKVKNKSELKKLLTMLNIL